MSIVQKMNVREREKLNAEVADLHRNLKKKTHSRIA